MQTTAKPFLLTVDEGSAYWFFGSLLILKVSADDLTMIEQVVPPGAGSPYHVHLEEDEVFYILEGEMSFVSGDATWKGGPGTSVFLPRGIPHGFRTEGSQPSRSLLLTTSGEFDRFVRELGEPAAEWVIPPAGPIDMGRVMASAARHQLQILGPLPEYTV